MILGPSYEHSLIETRVVFPASPPEPDACGAAARTAVGAVEASPFRGGTC